MPRIPQASPKVGVPSAPSVRQNVRAQPGAFGMGTARALTQAGDVGQKISAELQQRRNVVEVQNAYLAATEALDQYLHDPENGVYNRKGRNAAGSFDEVREKLPEIEAEFTANLSGRQRELFERQWRQATLPAVRGAMNHESREITNERAQTLEALVSKNAERMSLNFTDMQSVKSFAEITKANIMTLADMAGWSRDLRLAKEKEIMSKAYAAVFERHFAVDDVEGATKILDTFGGEMSDGVKSKLRNDLRAKERALYVEEQADLVSAMHDDEGNAMKYIRENYSGPSRKDITGIVQAQFQTKRRVERERQNEQYFQGFEQIHGASNRAEALRIANKEPDQETRSRLLQVVDSKHPPMRAGVGGTGKLSDQQKEINKMRKYIAERNILNAVKKQIEEDPEFYKEPRNVAKLLADNDIFSKEILEDVHEYALKGGIYGEIDKSYVLNGLKALGVNTYESLGIRPPDGARRDRQISEGDVPQELLQFVVDAARGNDGKLSDRQLQDVLRQGLKPGTIEGDWLGGLWGGDTTPFYKAMMKGEERQVDIYARMSDKEKAEIKSFLVAAKRFDDVENINALARDWAIGEQEEMPDSAYLKGFYDWVKRKQEFIYTDTDGQRVKMNLMNEATLQNPRNWAILRMKYDGLRGQRR